MWVDFDRITDLNKKIIGSIPIINDEIIIFSRDDDSTIKQQQKHLSIKLQYLEQCLVP